MLLKHTGAVRSSLWRGAKRTQAAEPDDLFICTRSASGRRWRGGGLGGGVMAKVSSGMRQILHAAKQLSIESTRQLC